MVCCCCLFGCAAIGVVYAQKEWREYPYEAQTPWIVPPDYKVPREWTGRDCVMAAAVAVVEASVSAVDGEAPGGRIIPRAIVSSFPR